MSDETTKKELQSVDTNTIRWGENYIEQIQAGIPVKELISDPDTGMSVSKVKYVAGFTNVWHRHNCSHGMYVLDGILKTHAGEFGPVGSRVSSPKRSGRVGGRAPGRDLVGETQPEGGLTRCSFAGPLSLLPRQMTEAGVSKVE